MELSPPVWLLAARLPIIHHWSTGCDRSTIEPVALIAVLMSTVIFATTLHCQDFKDAEGDRMIGRKTLPILFPSLARISVMVGLPLWSICLACLWKIDVICSAAFVAYASLVGMRFVMLQGTQADRKSCQLYSVSLLGPDRSSYMLAYMVHSCGSLLLICCQDIGGSSMALELVWLPFSFQECCTISSGLQDRHIPTVIYAKLDPPVLY